MQQDSTNTQFHRIAAATADPLTVEERALASAARQALLQQTAKHPVSAAVLWLTCAHLAAYTTLPSQVIHRQVVPMSPAQSGRRLVGWPIILLPCAVSSAAH